MTEDQRLDHLRRAEYNVGRIDPVHVAVELGGDALQRPFLERSDAVARGLDEGAALGPDLVALAERIYGPARYVIVNKGRSAELALFPAMARPGAVVVAHPLFFTTQRAFHRAGALIEVAPFAGADSSDLDLGWLARRLTAGGVDFVCVEPATNANGGLPMSLGNMEAIHALCQEHHAALLMDATRLLANCARLGEDTLGIARRFTKLSDAFVVGCSKELLAPSGGLIAVRDDALQQKLLDFCFMEGCELHPVEERLRLAGGMRHLAENPSLIDERGRQLRSLASALRARGVPTIEPVGCFAVYVDIEDAVAPQYIPAIGAFLYRHAGIRCSYMPLPMSHRVLRLALGIGRYTDAQLEVVAPAIRALLDRGHALLPLRPKRPGQSMFYGGMELVAPAVPTDR